MTTTQAAAKLGVSSSLIRKAIASGQLAATRTETPRGAVFAVAEADLMTWSASRRQPGQPKKRSTCVHGRWWPSAVEARRCGCATLAKAEGRV